MRLEQKKILAEAIKTFGIVNQVDMALEECAELIQAVNKAKRSKVFEGTVSRISCVKNGNIKAFDDLCNEVADVKIMIAQLEMILCEETIKLRVDRKVQRLQRRLEEYKENYKPPFPVSDILKQSIEEDFVLDRLLEWLMDENRKPANVAFTSGMMRVVAREMEFNIWKAKQKNG